MFSGVARGFGVDVGSTAGRVGVLVVAVAAFEAAEADGDLASGLAEFEPDVTVGSDATPEAAGDALEATWPAIGVVAPRPTVLLLPP